MILVRRFYIIFSTFLLGCLLELFLWQPKWYYLLFFLLELVVIGNVLSLVKGKVETKEIWLFLIAPFFFIGFGFLFLFFVEGIIWQELLILIIVFFWWIFIENIFLFLHQPVRYQPYALENITAYLNLFTVFFLSASFYHLAIFLGFEVWWLVFFIFLINFCLVIQTIWINKIGWRNHLSLVFLLSFLIAEMFWVEGYLPTGYLVNGIFLTICYYFLTNIARHWLTDSLDRRVIKRYLWISGGATLLVFLTSKWF